jgi:hypothetical protein
MERLALVSSDVHYLAEDSADEESQPVRNCFSPLVETERPHRMRPDERHVRSLQDGMTGRTIVPMGEGPSQGSKNSPELEALTAVVAALEPLSPEMRLRIVDSALTFLGTKAVQTNRLSRPPAAPDETPGGLGREAAGPSLPAPDIRSLKDQKQPQSANEMAALVAYYVSEAMSGSEKKDAVDVNDMVKYFKQGNFRLPANPKMILVNAKNAGYFDAVGSGGYKLNPVGYNLVAHSLPRAASAERVGGVRRTRKRTGVKRVKAASPKKARRS